MRKMLACSTLALLLGCGGDPGQQVIASDDANVILISVDTLRSDRLPAYGYGGVETPAIDALRRDGVLYRHAYSHYPLTFPSHVSLLTGELPTSHGVRDNIGYRMKAGAKHLAGWLRERGYATGAAVSAWILRSDTGLAEGFDFYEDSLDLRGGVSLGESQRPGATTVDRALEWLPKAAEKGKFFLFLHLYEPHTPWAPPEPWASRYADPYDGEIATADALVGRVLAELKRLLVYDESLIVFLSDHGEGLGEHGEQEHGILLYREAIQVPLIVKLPKGQHAGATVEVPAGLVDVAPTVWEVLGEKAEGRISLLDLLAEEPPIRSIYSETYYPRLHLGWSDLASLVDDRFHYIEGPDPELYDVRSEPAEQVNVLRDERRAYAELRDELASLRTELEAPSDVDEESQERLAALGYLSGTAATTAGPLPDPKSQLPSLELLTDAFRFYQKESYPEAIATFKEVLDGNPGMIDAWEHLALCYQGAGLNAEAEQAFREALERSGGTDHIALGMARFYLELGRLDEARAHAQLALATNPVTAHQVLGEIEFVAEDFQAAERHAQQSLEQKSGGIGALVLMAQVRARQDLLDEALEWLQKAEREQAKRHGEESTPGLLFVKGDLLARLGETEKAKQSFRLEIERHPHDTRAYCGLSLILALEQKGAEAVAVLRQMVETNPQPSSYAAAVETLRALGDARSAQALLQHALGQFPGDSLLRTL